MKKVALTMTFMLLIVCGCESTLEKKVSTIHLLPTSQQGGVTVDPSIDEDVLMTEAEVIAYASEILEVDETNPEVTWISSEEFYTGYEHVLDLVGTPEEIAAYYDTLRIVPSQALCVANFSNASALINPDKRSGRKLVVGHVGITIDPDWFDWIDFEDDYGVTTFEDLLDAQPDIPGPVDHWKFDCTKLKQCTDILFPPMPIDSVNTVTHALCSVSDLEGVYNDCDSIARSFTLAFTRPIDPIGGGGFPSLAPAKRNIVSSDIEDYTPAEFMQLEYCEMIPYIERKLGWDYQGVPLAIATMFLNSHGITVTTYTGNTEAMIRQTIIDGNIPLLYKDGEWSFVFKYLEHTYRNSTIKYTYFIDPCYPDLGLNVVENVYNEYTVVVLEY